MSKKNLLLLDECSMLGEEMLRNNGWSLCPRMDVSRARRFLASQPVDLIAATIDRKSADHIALVLELCSLHSISALVFCAPDQVDSLSYQFRSVPVLVLPNTASRQVIGQMLDYLRKNIEQTQRINESLRKEKRKAQDEKLVSQAKIQLCVNCRWSEEKAHQYILKTAMDHSMTKAAAARQILARLERILNESPKNQCHAAA